MIFWMALRNIGRNRRRTALAVVGIAIGTALAITMSAFQYGAWEKMLRTAIAGTAGHVVVQATGWQEEHDAALVVPDSGAVAAELQALWPESTVLRRVMIGGLLTSPRGSAAIGVAGLEPDKESANIMLDERVVEGRWLREGELDAIVIGDALARTLQVGVDDKVVFMTQVGDADVDSRMLRVRGIYHTGAESLDAFAATVALQAVQPLLPGRDAVSQVAMLLPGTGIGEVDIAPAVAALGGRGLDVLSWQGAMPGMEEQMQLDTRFNDWLYLILLVVIAVGVLNTVLMGMMERVRELGVMLAVGMQGWQLGVMLLLEGVWIGLLGAAGALFISALAYKPLYVDGIDYGDLMAEAMPVGVAMDTVMRASLDPMRTVEWLVVAVVMSVLASLWPAWQATRLQPVEAMRHV